MPGRHVTDNQMRLFMNYTRTHTVETAAAKTSFSVSTGHRIRWDPRLPSEKARRRAGKTAAFPMSCGNPGPSNPDELPIQGDSGGLNFNRNTP